MKKQKKQSKQDAHEQSLDAFTKGGQHGAYDHVRPILNESSRPGRHSGRNVPMVTTSLGGDKLPSGENGGGVGAGNDPEPAQPGPLLPKSLRGATPVYAATAKPTPADSQHN